MPYLKIKNRAASTLASGVSDTDTTWVVAAGEGVKFPTTGDFHLTCEDEIVKCTARTVDTLTVVRAQEGTTAVAHVAGKSVELRITTGVVESRTTWTANKLLKGAGTGVDPSEIDVFDIFDKFREFVPWVSLDGFTVGGDAGYDIIARGAYVRLTTGTTLDYDAFLYSLLWYNLLDAGKLITFEFPLTFLTDLNTNVWLRLAFSADDPPSETVSHIGWKIIGDASYNHLYASNGSGVSQTIIDTEVDIAGDSFLRLRLKIVLNPGTDCKFYVNDVLKATHTTDLPTGNYFRLHIHLRTKEAALKILNIGRILLEKEHA